MRPSCASWVFAALFFLSSACDSDGSSAVGRDPLVQNPPIQKVSLWLEPSDGFTSVGDSKLTLGVSGSPSQSVLDDLAGRLSLRTYPELGAVPVSASTYLATDTDAGQTTARVELSPTGPLGNRWYVLRVSSLPPDAEWAPGSLPIVLSDGSFGARFRPDSFPRVWGVTSCSKSDGSEAVSILASERMYSLSSAASLVSLAHVDGSPIDCRVTQEPTNAAQLDRAPFRCTGLDRSKEVKLTIEPGFFGYPSTPLSDAGTFRFTVSLLPTDGDGCSLFRP